MITRRTLLRGLALGVTGPLGAACGSAREPRPLTVAAGEDGGFYLEFAQLLADELTDDQPWLRAVPVATSGSWDNLGRLSDRSVDLALTLSDTAREAVLGGAALRALGRV